MPGEVVSMRCVWLVYGAHRTGAGRLQFPTQKHETKQRSFCGFSHSLHYWCRFQWANTICCQRRSLLLGKLLLHLSFYNVCMPQELVNTTDVNLNTDGKFLYFIESFLDIFSSKKFAGRRDISHRLISRCKNYKYYHHLQVKRFKTTRITPILSWLLQEKTPLKIRWFVHNSNMPFPSFFEIIV